MTGVESCSFCILDCFMKITFGKRKVNNIVIDINRYVKHAEGYPIQWLLVWQWSSCIDRIAYHYSTDRFFLMKRFVAFQLPLNYILGMFKNVIALGRPLMVFNGLLTSARKARPAFRETRAWIVKWKVGIEEVEAMECGYSKLLYASIPFLRNVSDYGFGIKIWNRSIQFVRSSF